MNQTESVATSTLRSATDDAPPLLTVEHLTVDLPRDEEDVRIVHDVTLSLRRGQAIGIVGESGCGKTMTANALLRILPRAAQISGGRAIFQRHEHIPPVDLFAIDADSRQMRRMRGRDIAMIFQEPMTAFSPVHTIFNQIAEAIVLHQKLDRRTVRQRVVELLSMVGIPDPAVRADDYPFQLSGGMRQRAMIAMALAANPALLIADEPTTALDVTVQAQVLKLIKQLQRRFGIALMLITHDLGVIAHMVDYVYVMYLGRIVEQGPVRAIFSQPHHPYTQALLRSMPSLTDARRKLEPIRGTVPDSRNPPAGCPFHDRCDVVVGDICRQQQPAHYVVGPGQQAGCFKHSPDQSPSPPSQVSRA